MVGVMGASLVISNKPLSPVPGFMVPKRLWWAPESFSMGLVARGASRVPGGFELSVPPLWLGPLGNRTVNMGPLLFMKVCQLVTEGG